VTDIEAPASRVPPLVLISGPETVLAERGLSETLEALRITTPDLEVVRLYAASYESGEVALHASPSLFGGDKAIVVRDLDEAGDDLLQEIEAHVREPAPGVTLIVTHKGGNRGKRVLDALKAARARVIDAPAIKKEKDKADFATNEFRRARRRATEAAVQALVEAVGSDVSELAAACAQLVSDTTGVIDDQVVLTYYGGKVEATGYRVADAALAGNAGEALRLLRHAIAVGVDPVPIVGNLAGQLRLLIRVGTAGRGQPADIGRELGIPPWKVTQARRALSGWTAEALGRCVQAVAAADFAVKGGAKDPVYAVEQVLVTITREHGAGR
jgi:DNA polymerase-3 subunit delta